jgi:signal transduction histidine kinase
MMRSVRTGEIVSREEAMFERADGTRGYLEVSSAPVRNAAGEIIAGAVLFQDISERKRAEESLRQSERLADAGRMAAAIAHEINNPLEAVTNLLYLLRHDDSLGSSARELVQMAEHELARVGQIARRTLGFYREHSAPELVDVAALLDSILNLYAPHIQAQGVRVNRRYDSQPSIFAISGELRQVFLNLVANALDAAGRGGCVTVHVFSSRNWEHPERRGARIMIGDSGPGIAADVRGKMFEPFFTTKGDRGTGLGLWVVKGIITKHQGAIRVSTSTRPGRTGTCFSVFLPKEGIAPLSSRPT